MISTFLFLVYLIVAMLFAIGFADWTEKQSGEFSTFDCALAGLLWPFFVVFAFSNLLR